MMENLVPQLGQRLFPASEKAGCKSSSADVPDICDHCSKPRPAQTEVITAHFALLLAKNFYQRIQLLMTWKNKPKNTLILHWQTHEVKHSFKMTYIIFFSTLFSIRNGCVYFKINSKVQWGQKWLEVVSDPIEQNYNYLVLHLVVWPTVPGVDLLLSAVWARPNTVKLLKWGQRSGFGTA